MTSLDASRVVRSVIVYATVDTFADDRGAIALALAFCRSTRACLTGMLLNIEANEPPRYETLKLDDLRQKSEQREARNAHNAEVLRAMACKAGIAVQTLTAVDHSRGVIGFLADHARLHDLLVIGTDGSGPLSDRVIAENVLFETGRPMLVAPPSWTGELSCRRVAVAWDNSRGAARALGDALALFPQIEEIAMVTVGDDKALASSLEANEVMQIVRRRGVSAKFEHIAGRGRPIADVLQDYAADSDADMLVMGAYAHSRLRDFILGGATLSVLAAPRLPVLMSY